MAIRYLFEEWDDENLARKYPLRKTADLGLAGPDGSLSLPTDFLLDAVICAPGFLSDFVLYAIVVSGDNVKVVVNSPVERLEANVKVTSDFAPLLGQESGSVYGCLIFGKSAINFRHKKPGTYYANLTNKFVPRVFRSIPKSLTSITVNGQKLFGDIYITMGRGVSLDSDDKVDLTGNKYFYRDRLYNTLRPGDTIALPALSVNNKNLNGVYDFEAWDVGSPNTQRLKVRSILPDTLVIEDVKDFTL